MAEDSDLERTEPASGKRISEARAKGQVARSRELTTLAMLFASAGALIVMGPKLMDSLSSLMRHGLTLTRAEVFDETAMASRLYQESLDVLFTFLPFFFVLVVAAIASSLVISGWLFTWDVMMPNFGKLDPFKGVLRLFSVTSLVELVKALAKSILIGGVATWFVWHNLDLMLGLIALPLDEGMAQTVRLVGDTLLVVSTSMILIVAIDVPFQLWDHAKKLRMTKEELKQEAKESDGSPEVKARIRSMQREASRRRMMAEVPKADVIVTNPTHFAVALRYQNNNMRAPQVVAKGSYLLAERIIELGKEHHVPVLRTPPLARALYRHAELGEEIPSSLYTAVAEVLAYIYQLKQYEVQGGTMPQAPVDLPVPAELDPGAIE